MTAINLRTLAAYGFATSLFVVGTASAYPNATPFPGTGTLETLTEVGQITQIQNYDPNINFTGEAPGDFYVGETMTLTVTYDSAEVYTPSTQIPNAGAYGWTAVPLANGDSFNSVSLTIGSHSWNLSDQFCANPAAGATCGQQFAYGPTLLQRNGQFAGLDSCLGITTQAHFACGLALDNLGTPFAQATDGPLVQANAMANPVIPTRSDNVYIGDSATGSIFAVGHYDSTFFTAVPEPEAWALMLAGFGLVGAASRARRRPIFAA